MTDAEAQFQKAVEVSPNSGGALLELGRIQNDSGKTDAAERTFKRASGLPDKKYQSLHAIFLWQQGKKDAALREFAELAKRDPKDRAARTRLVAAYLGLKNTPEAMRILSEALKKNPNDADALVQRGEFYLDEGDVPAAEADLTRAVGVGRHDAMVCYLLSRIYKARSQESLRRQELQGSNSAGPIVTRHPHRTSRHAH